MALPTLIDLVKIKQIARIDAAKSPAVAEMLRAFYKHCEQLTPGSSRQFALVPFTTSGAADVVLSDSPCKVYVVMFKKRAGSTTAAWLKFSDHASAVAADPDLGVKLNATAAATKAQAITFPDGLPMATGLCVASHTAVGGTTDSAAADSQDGFVIIGAP